MSGVDRPDEWTDDSAKVGKRRESVRVFRRDADGSKEYSDEIDDVRGR